MSKASNTLDSISTIPSKAEQEHHLTFESLKQEESESEFWSARKLAKALGYSGYRNFIIVIEKAKKACNNSSHDTVDHFVDVTEMIELGKGEMDCFLRTRSSSLFCNSSSSLSKVCRPSVNICCGFSITLPSYLNSYFNKTCCM